MSMSPQYSPKKTVAIIGSGIAGLSAAYRLQSYFHIEVFEKQHRIGGHTNTVFAELPNHQQRPIDTGFIVYNEKNYPLFTDFLRKLNVPTQDSDMSFSYWNLQNNFVYSGSGIMGLIARLSNLWRKDFWRMIEGILRFNESAKDFLTQNHSQEISLGEFLDSNSIDGPAVQYYLIPMAAAIWSSPRQKMFEFPAKAFLAFFQNHGLLELSNRPQWKTIQNGSQSYLKAFKKQFNGEFHLDEEVLKLRSHNDFVELTTSKRSKLQFDYAVLASHADESLRLLEDPSPEEKHALSTWKYQSNIAVLHTDPKVMPPSKRAWSAWNYIHDKSDSYSSPASLTYYMNKLQNIPGNTHYFVSLNPVQKLDDNLIIRTIEYHHPVYSLESWRSQLRIKKLNGLKRRFYCGSYMGYGFHEDAFRSSHEMAQQLKELA